MKTGGRTAGRKSGGNRVSQAVSVIQPGVVVYKKL